MFGLLLVTYLCSVNRIVSMILSQTTMMMWIFPSHSSDTIFYKGMSQTSLINWNWLNIFLTLSWHILSLPFVFGKSVHICCWNLSFLCVIHILAKTRQWWWRVSWPEDHDSPWKPARGHRVTQGYWKPVEYSSLSGTWCEQSGSALGWEVMQSNSSSILGKLCTDIQYQTTVPPSRLVK